MEYTNSEKRQLTYIESAKKNMKLIYLMLIISMVFALALIIFGALNQQLFFVLIGLFGEVIALNSILGIRGQWILYRIITKLQDEITRVQRAKISSL